MSLCFPINSQPNFQLTKDFKRTETLLYNQAMKPFISPLKLPSQSIPPRAKPSTFYTLIP